jgi:SPRY domain
MITPGSANPLLLGGEGYQISRSLRLRASATAYLNRAPVSAGNRQKWTWSGWVKVGDVSGSAMNLFGSGDGTTNNYTRLQFITGNIQFINAIGGSSAGSWQSASVYRDPSAWYHVVVMYDSTNATPANRLTLYVNNVAVVGSFSTAVTLNANTWVNSTNAHYMGRESYSASAYFDGYMTEVNFIDGQALTPSSFGQTDPVTGVWQPKKYAGTYGANGFYLNFSDPSAATAAAIGKDYSGNGNNWTPNGISVTAGITYDSMLDVPTMWADGGNGRGNYATLNPLRQVGTVSTVDGNLKSSISSGDATATSTFSVSSGKWYWEFTAILLSSNAIAFGVNQASSNQSAMSVISYAGGVGYYGNNGNKYVSGTASAYGSSFTDNDVIGCALDADAGTITFYKNSISQGSITLPAGGSNWTPCASCGSATSQAFAFNAGQRPFSYTPPTGFKALNTQNMPDAPIKKGGSYFDATLYTGTNASLPVVNSGFQPDLVWMKRRNLAAVHVLIDSVRGSKKGLNSDTTNAEGTATAGSGLISFDAGGFTIGTEYDGGSGSDNASGSSYVAWNWKKGVTQGFDIVTYTGNGATQNVAHSLGVAPKMVIVKPRVTTTTTDNWLVGLASLSGGFNDYLELNNTNAKGTASNRFNNTAPTSSVFTVGTAYSDNTKTYVAYCFAEVAGFSKFGSYTGNGSADGPFVYLGFRPRYIMWKRTDSTSDWSIIDTARSTYNVQNDELYADSNIAESAAGAPRLDSLSNGFKVRNAGGAAINASGGTYIYAAFAENPFKNSLAR